MESIINVKRLNEVAEFLHLLVNHFIFHNFLQGQVPFFVTATAGTTVLGAFDPFNDIADRENLKK